MVVPYGFGVGDFVAVGTLAWNVYKSCRAAPGSFKSISTEVLSLHAVLKEADETIFRSPLSPESQARLKTIGDGCQCVLGDLQALVDKYESLGTQSKRTWDRMKWGAEDIVEVRSRIISNTTLLTAFISTSQTSVEQKLDKLISDFQQGKRAPSVVSLQTVDSLDPDDKEAWRTIRKELEDIGISVAAFDANKDFIFEWFSNAVDTGAFQEQAASSPSRSVYSLDVPSSTSSLSISGGKESNKTMTSNTEPPKANKATSKLTGNHTTIKVRQASNETGAAAKPHSQVIPTKIPRVAALIATLSRTKKRLINAVVEDDVDRIKKILTSSATSRLIDRPALNAALQSASQATSREACALLIDAGAEINKDHRSGRPLTRAVGFGNQDLVALLLDKGADMNYQDGDWSPLTRALHAGNQDLVALLLDKGADVNYQDGVWRPLTEAVRAGNQDLVALLLDKGADVNYQDMDASPLTRAVRAGNQDLVALLLDKGADVNYHDGVWRPFTEAVRTGNQDLVALLLDKGADMNYQEGEGTYSSALRAAIECSDKAMITFLAQRGADINAVQKASSPRILVESRYPTAIHQASAQSSASVVDLLISLGANITNSQRGFGTPLMLAIYRGCLATAEVLIKRGADVNEVPGPLGKFNHRFRSTMHIAIYVSAPDLVKLLLKKGAVTDWHDATEFAQERERFAWGNPHTSTLLLADKATAVLNLIKEKLEQESAVRD